MGGVEWNDNTGFTQVIDSLPEKNKAVIFKTRWTGEKLIGIYDGSSFLSNGESKLRKYDCFLDVSHWKYKEE